MRKAAVCVGSNAVRMLIADHTNGNVFNIGRYREDARPFAGLVMGEFTRQSIDRIAYSIAKMYDIARDMQADEVSLTATSSVRDSRNAGELRRVVMNATGLNMRVLTGEEEAHFSFIGASGDSRTGVVDIGGGSTEIAYLNKDKLLATSIQAGAVRLKGDMQELGGLYSALEFLENIFKREIEALGAPPPNHFAAVGGTVTTLAKIKTRGISDIEGLRLARDEILDMLRKLSTMTEQELLQTPGLPSRRADVIVPGAVIVAAFVNAARLSDIVVTERGNLDGIMLDRNNTIGWTNVG